eukprot:gnl/TRDRNA2_/TRDRNA2_160251_c1_seq2.p1 gnl/TRDRNA2_/TRDRNA2_160251_c1~~gnl/TRDRNA2_/TRDRNA2_160251_c1_seq2.p1  ORF type:complete len:362 (+),score=62.47 gnl/TRDRNA2_/TRDRNA2_160251_c1_seq2:101-1087(+)
MGAAPVSPTEGVGREGGSLCFFNFDRHRERIVAEGVMNFDVALDGQNVLAVLEDGQVRVLSAEQLHMPREEPDGPRPEDRGLVDFSSRISLEVHPHEEWIQMFHEVWRRLQLHFFDEDMGGVDWLAVRRRYEPLLDLVCCRADLGDVVAEMLGELGASHLQCREPGKNDSVQRSAMGFVGADLVWDAEVGGYEISRLTRGDPWDVDSCGPLCRATPRVAAGAYILAVNRQRLTEHIDMGRLLYDREGHDIFVTLVDAQHASKVAPYLAKKGGTVAAQISKDGTAEASTVAKKDKKSSRKAKLRCQEKSDSGRARAHSDGARRLCWRGG